MGRRPVFITEYQQRVKRGETSQLETFRAISAVVSRVFDDLGLTEASPEQLQGRTVESATNGDYSFTLRGSIGAKQMTLVSRTNNTTGSPKTYRLSIPHGCPDHLFVSWVQENLADKVRGVVSPRGRYYPVVDPSAP